MDVKGINRFKYGKEDMIEKLNKQLTEIEKRKEEIARLPDKRIDNEDVIEEIKYLNKKEEEIEDKLNQLDEYNDKDSVFVSRG